LQRSSDSTADGDAGSYTDAAISADEYADGRAHAAVP
jgi:hypothetical protein